MVHVQASQAHRPIVTPPHLLHFNPQDRRSFIGGSDARIIMGADEAILLRLWEEKRGKIEPEDLTDNLIVQLGSITEDAHHLKFAQGRAMGRKVSDEFTVPLYRDHHDELHRYGNERAWWTNLTLTPLDRAKELWEASPAHSASANGRSYDLASPSPTVYP